MTEVTYPLETGVLGNSTTITCIYSEHQCVLTWAVTLLVVLPLPMLLLPKHVAVCPRNGTLSMCKERRRTPKRPSNVIVRLREEECQVASPAQSPSHHISPACEHEFGSLSPCASCDLPKMKMSSA